MLDRRVAPVFNRNFSFQLIDPEYKTLHHGAEVIFVNGGQQNVTKVELIFPAGRWYENPWGVSYFTTHLLNKGTASKSSFEISSIFDRLGAHFDVSPGVDHITLSLYSLTKNLSKALDLMIEIVNGSIFPDKELEQLKSIYTQNLKVNQEKTSFLASRSFKKVLFGNHHPYGKELEESDVEKLRREDVARFHKEAFGQFKVIVSGKINPGDKTKIIDSFESIVNPTIQEKDYQPQPSGSYRHHTEKENSLQSSLRIGKKIIGRKHPDYAQLIFLNHILGGYFGSRLMKNIREEKGLTYGIYSSVHAMVHDSYLTIGTDVNKENRELAFAEIHGEIRRLCNEKIDNEELDTARYHFIGSFETELSTAFAHAEKIKSIALFNLDKGHYNSLLQKIADTTSDDLLSIAQEYFGDEKFFEVSAG